MTRKKAVKKKIEIVFDPQKRKEFLTGFRKRKNERRTRAKAELERNLKEEHKRIRLELKEGFKHLKRSYEPLRELTEEDKQEPNDSEGDGEVYEDEEVQVKITELTTNDLAAQRNMLGENRADESDDEENAEQSASEDEMQQVNCIPGMDFDVSSKLKKSKTADNAIEDQTAEESDENVKSKKKKPTIDVSEVRSKKDINRLMKTKTINKLKKTKLFKMKERFDKQNNQKKTKRDRNSTLRSVPKHQRKKLKYEPNKSRYRKGRLMNRKEMRKRRSGGDD